MIMFKIAIWVDIMTFNLLNEKPTGANLRTAPLGYHVPQLMSVKKCSQLLVDTTIWTISNSLPPWPYDLNIFKRSHLLFWWNKCTSVQVYKLRWMSFMKNFLQILGIHVHHLVSNILDIQTSSFLFLTLKKSILQTFKGIKDIAYK